MCLGVSDELWCEASRSASKVRRSLVKRCWREAVWSSVLSGQAFRSSVLATRSGQAFWLRNLVMRSCAHTATKRAGFLAPNKQNTLLSTLHVCPRGSSEERLGRLAAAAAAAAAAVVGGGGSSSSGSGGGSDGGGGSSACAGGGWHVGGAARGGDGPGWLLLAARTAGGTAGSAALECAGTAR